MGVNELKKLMEDMKEFSAKNEKAETKEVMELIEQRLKDTYSFS
ncbi:hypothetical protein [Salipaludibacillus daqingensis]|nr:hypothetical protein [Salipaludibacillus daqingensis]